MPFGVRMQIILQRRGNLFCSPEQIRRPAYIYKAKYLNERAGFKIE